jgi:DNA repair exonuclease SbcCD ATPase subunit
MSARKPAQQRRVESSRLSVQELEESITRANSELCTLHERKHALLQEQQDHRDRLRAITQHLNELGNEMHSVHRELDTLKIRAYDSFVVKPQPGMETQPGKQPPLPNEVRRSR